jgi:hypothetical protein
VLFKLIGWQVFVAGQVLTAGEVKTNADTLQTWLSYTLAILVTSGALNGVAA